MSENAKILNEWCEQIASYPKLSLSEAIKMYQLFLRADNQKEKLKIREEIICGTLHIMAEFIAANSCFFINNGTFDMNDVINACNEEWIKAIDSGILLKKTFISQILNHLFWEHVSESIIDNHFKENNNYIFHGPILTDLIYETMVSQDNGELLDYENIFRSLNDKTTFEKARKVQETTYLLINIAKLLKNKKIKFSREEVNKFKYLLICYAEELAKTDISVLKEENFADNIINELYFEKLLAVIKSKLSKFELDIFFASCGFYQEESKSLKEIAKNLGLTNQKVLQIRKRTLKEIRDLMNIKHKR